MHLHGGAMPEFMQRYPRWTSHAMRAAAAVVTPSAFLSRPVQNLARTVRIIPNVLELEAYPYRFREQVAPRLFWMRAYHEIYNPLMAIRVLARLRSIFPDATLAMAGQSKGMWQDVSKEAHDLGVAGAFEMLGFLDERQKVEVASRRDIFINTTHVDNAPVGVVEMCAMGLPVVSTSVGGVPDLLTHEQTGLLVPDGDVQAMTDAIVRLVREPALAARLSRNGPELAARCAWPAVLEQWEALFAEIL
jgi:glycosyltransferase involved in cell wall biosynthesis